MNFIDKLHIKNIRIPHFLSSLFSLVLLVLFFFGLLAVFVPLIIQQANTIFKYDFLTYLEQAKILNSIRKIPKGVGGLLKPNKIYLENPNFNYALQNNPDAGTVRETFF